MTFDIRATTFNLSAVNWRSVSLLEGAHLDADRIYLEEMIRCSLFFDGRWGVAELGESDLIPGQESSVINSQRVGIRLKRCYAITPQGYLICWNSENQPGEGVFGSADSAKAGETVPIFLCIDADREAAYANPPQEIRNECSFLRPRFYLATQTGEGELDALKIGQLKRDGNGRLQLDKEFIPACLRLNSHWLLKKRVKEIQQRARTCLDSLVKQLNEGQFRLEAMATPLASAAVLIDGTISPYAYLERMLAVMRAHFALQYLIPSDGVKGKVYAALDLALKYIELNLQADTLDWTETLRLIEATFKALEGAFTGQKPGGDWTIIQDDPIR